MIFETERLTVSHYEFNRDADNFYALNSDEEIMRYIRPTKTKEECDKYLKEIIAAYIERPLLGRWAVHHKQTGKYTGSFAIIPIEGTGDIQLGYSLLKENWGKGFATELTRGGLDYYFANSGADHIYAIAEKANTASHKVLLKNGFVHDGIKTEGEKILLKFIFKKTI